MLRFKNFLRTTLLGGFAAMLPMALVIVVFRWIFTLVTTWLAPLVDLINTDSRLEKALVYLFIIATILALFFFVGLIIRTRIGRFFDKVFEDKYLSRIPGYKIVKETVQQFFGKGKTFFSKVVLVDVFNCGTLMTGFVTDRTNFYTTVFVPTGPNPTSGNIYHVPNARVFETDMAIDSAMKSIISCGAGSDEILNKYPSAGRA